MFPVTDCGHHLSFFFPSSVAAPPFPTPWKKTISSPPYRNPSYGRRSQLCRTRRPDQTWDSNAEGGRYGRFGSLDRAFDEEGADGRSPPRKKWSWWSDDPSELDEESQLFDEDESSPLDRIWFVKLVRSYGWMLPAIVISMLLSTGPKAFLMALALPLGQSALSLAVDKLWGTTRDAPRRTSKARKKPFARAATTVEREDNASYSNGKGRSGFQSWVETVDDVAEKDVNPRGPQFGGWDALDRRHEPGNGPSSPPFQTKGRPPQPQPERKGKLTRGGRYAGMPLFIRLLVAVFPFLGSWTRIL